MGRAAQDRDVGMVVFQPVMHRLQQIDVIIRAVVQPGPSHRAADEVLAVEFVADLDHADAGKLVQHGGDEICERFAPGVRIGRAPPVHMRLRAAEHHDLRHARLRQLVGITHRASVELVDAGPDLDVAPAYAVAHQVDTDILGKGQDRDRPALIEVSYRAKLQSVISCRRAAREGPHAGRMVGAGSFRSSGPCHAVPPCGGTRDHPKSKSSMRV
ncbi:hypothetical protein [Oceaniovalibus guishaninsula]|uniref:hypothetical protein n=1 Tax=Oceaniovalibus guishaninsula TaxID=1046117 RepID=UPI0012E9B128|nr:hypothetical protein [Oceaniovalibus guishaninsula]